MLKRLDCLSHRIIQSIMFFALSHFVGLVTALHSLPPVLPSYSDTSDPGFSISTGARKIYIDKQFAGTRDSEGLTLIPPSAHEFADTLRADLSSLFGDSWTLEQVDDFPLTGIHLGPIRDSNTPLTYENGQSTEEGYELDVTNGSVYIGGTGARGMFWGTRTLLQELLIGNGSLVTGHTVDVPAYSTRGFMLDAGRKW